MVLSQPTGTVGLLLAVGVIVVAVLLTLRQRYERRQREPEPSEADARHYARQDVRRAVVGGVMVLLALGIAIGSWLEPKHGGRTNAWILAIWLAVFLLILALLWLALLDWIATWVYARRHRRAIARERIEYLRGERRRRAYRGNGRSHPQDPLDDVSAH